MADLYNEVLGSEVRLPERPSRIVSFSPAATETLFRLGAGDRIVGVSAFCARPDEARSKRKVGSYNTVRTEVLEEVDPDLVITVTGYQREFAVNLARKYPVYPLELPVTVAGIVDFVSKVGMVAGVPDEGRELSASLLGEVGRLKRQVSLRAYVELDLGGPVTFGAFSYITDAIGLLGSRCLYGDVRKEWLVPDLAEVVSKDPDVIFYEPKMFSKFTDTDAAELLKSRGWQGIRAVKAGNFFVTPGPLDFLAHHGPSFVTRVMPWLEGALRKAGESHGR